MTRNVKFILALSSASILLNPIIANANSVSPCDAPFSKNAIHCAYVSSPASQLTGKYLRIKATEEGHPSFTKIFCATTGALPVMDIPQSLSGKYAPGDKINWQFSQCLDEDCSASQMLVDDKFTITKSGDIVSSDTKNKVEVPLNPAYGVNCHASDTKYNNEYAVSPFIQDAVSLLNYIPQEIDSTVNILKDMIATTIQAQSGVMNEADLIALNVKYKDSMLEIDQLQRVNTLRGVKKVTGGTLKLSQTDNEKWSLHISVPVMDLDALGIRNTDVLSASDAQAAEVILQNAITSICKNEISKS